MPRSCITGNTSPHLKFGVEYDVHNLENSITEVYGQTTSAITVTCCVDYADSTRFLMDMLGYSKSMGTTLQRVLPEQSGWDAWGVDNEEKHFAIEAKLAKGLTWSENDLATGWPEYEQLLYEVTFVAPLYNVLEDADITQEHERFVLWTKKGAAVNEKVPGGGMIFPSDLTKLGEVGVKTGRTISLQARWLDVPYVNYDGIIDLSNKVNSASLTWDGMTYDPETVLFETWSEIKKVNAFGRRTVDLEFNFIVRTDDRTWNKFWRRDPAGGLKHEAPTADGTVGGAKVFSSGDLNGLFAL